MQKIYGSWTSFSWHCFRDKDPRDRLYCIMIRRKIWIINSVEKYNLLPNFVHATYITLINKLASVRILRKEREPGVGKLGWHGNFDTGFGKNNDKN